MTMTTEPLAENALISALRSSRLRGKRRTFKEVSTEAYGKGRDEGYATAARQFQEAQQRLLAENKRLQECLDKGIWSRLTDLFKGGRHAI